MTVARSPRRAVTVAFANIRNNFTNSSQISGVLRVAQCTEALLCELCMEGPEHTMVDQLQNLARTAFRGLTKELDAYTAELQEALTAELDTVDQMRNELAAKLAEIGERERRLDCEREALDQIVREHESLRRGYQEAVEEAAARELELQQLAVDQQHQGELALVNRALEQKCSEQQVHNDNLQREVEAIRSQVNRFATVAIDLADARATILEMREELATVRTANDGEDVAQMQQLLQDRTELELELETVRARAARLSEEAEAERARMAEERAHWAGELRQLRRTLDLQSQIRSDLPSNPEPKNAADTLPSVQSGEPLSPRANKDPVLDAVMAQFQQLQKDRVQRRGTVAPSGKQEVA